MVSVRLHSSAASSSLRGLSPSIPPSCRPVNAIPRPLSESNKNQKTHDAARRSKDLGGEVDTELGLDDTGVSVWAGDTARH